MQVTDAHAGHVTKIDACKRSNSIYDVMTASAYITSFFVPVPASVAVTRKISYRLSVIRKKTYVL